MVKSLVAALAEESTPLCFSESQRLAPRELYRPAKQPPKGATEMTQTDRNRIRRQNKMLRRSKAQQREERLRTAARLDPRKRSVLEKRDALKSLAKNKNVTILPKTTKKRGDSRGVKGSDKAAKRQ